MSRKKINFDEKKKNFGITIHPELNKLLIELSIKQNKTISKIIEKIMMEHFKL